MDIYIPPKFRNIFKFEEFNSVQSALCNEIFYSSRSLIVSAPTGCGKTVLFELNMIKFLVDCENTTTNETSCVLYIAPLKSLCHEKFTEWQSKFNLTDLKCIMYTGDSEQLDKDQLAPTTLIVTTPEKLDSLTKASDEEFQLLPLVRYCFVDEIHLLRDPDRGPLLEALVTRIKTVSNPRFICVSATMANSEDLAIWLSSPSVSAVFYNFGDEFRPALVQKIVLGFYRQKSQSIFQFDSILNYKLANVIASYSENKPVLIFCTTRRGTVQVARDLTKNNCFKTDPMFEELRASFAAQIKDGLLRDVLKNGVGYHHAGLDTEDRRVVEQAFISGCLPILASTSTLSMGMNLPAHLVIIKNTEQLINGQLVGYSSTQISQMIGRAGRPQFDSKGIAVVMTSSDLKVHYEKLLYQNDLIESCLRMKLSQYLNSEIALGTINTLADAVQWLKSTFFYVRMKKEPRLYGFTGQLSVDRSKCIESYLQDICATEIRSLQSLGLVEFNEEDSSVNVTALGKLMMKNSMEPSTIRMVWELNGTETLEDLVHFVGCCSELSDISLRTSEKMQLNNINRARGLQALRYPLNGRISTVPMKIVCLLQAQLSGVRLNDFSLQNDVQRICRCARRILNGLAGLLWLDSDDTDFTKQKKSTTVSGKPVHYPVASSAIKCMVNVLEFKKTLQFLTWLNKPLVSLFNLQILGAEDIEKLLLAGLMTVHSVENTTPAELERILGKQAPFGEQLLTAVRLIPKYILEVEQTVSTDPNKLVVQFCVKSSRACAVDTVIVLIGDKRNQIIGKYRLKPTDLSTDGFTGSVSVSSEDAGHKISFSVISTNFAGIDLHTSFTPTFTSSSLNPRLPRYQTQSKTGAPGAFPDLSVGYVEDVEFSTHQTETCDEETKLKITWPEVKSTQAPHELTSPVPQPISFPQPPVTNTKRMPPNKFIPSNKRIPEPRTKRHPIKPSNETSKVKSTFTWTPATPGSAPKVPLIQTSMLDYMRSRNEEMEVVKDITQPMSALVGSSSNLINTPIQAVPQHMPTLTRSDPVYRKFRWNPLNEYKKPDDKEQENRGDFDQQVAIIENEYISFPQCDELELAELEGSVVQENPCEFQSMTEVRNFATSEMSKENPTNQTLAMEEENAQQICNMEFNGELEAEDQLDWSPVNVAVEEELDEYQQNSLENLHQSPVELLLSPIKHVTEGDKCFTPSAEPTLTSELHSSKPPSPAKTTITPDVPLIEKLPEHRNSQGQYIMGNGSATIKSVYTPLSFPKFCTNEENRPRFSITPRETPEHKKLNSSVPSSKPKQDAITDTPKRTTTPNVAQPFQFKAPTDIRFEKLLHKWRRLNNQEESRSRQTLQVDMDLISEGWDELACWIHVTELCSQYNMEYAITQSSLHETPRPNDPVVENKALLTRRLSEVTKTTTVPSLVDRKPNPVFNTPCNSEKPSVDLDQYSNPTAVSEE